MQRVGVIGFGFSGLITVANLVRCATQPLVMYIIDDNADGFGVAYSTKNPEHLLNVRAANMSAFIDATDDFVRWLGSSDAALPKANHGIGVDYSPDDFVPRVLYGAYLASIWRDTQEIAAQKKLEIKIVPSRAVAVQKNSAISVLTERGDAIVVDEIVLAVGHEVKPIFPLVKSPHIIQNPWGVDALAGAASWPSPVMLVGTGLTAVDMVLSLRRAGYVDEIIAASRRGLWPQMHAVPTAIFHFAAEEIAAQKTLQQWLRLLRNKIRKVGDWRVVIDALRPHAHSIWQRLGTQDQQRFLARLLPLWNVHRHRMAPEIAARMQAEIAAKKLRVVRSKTIDVWAENDQLCVSMEPNDAAPRVSRMINCAGLELNLARSSNTLLKQLLADGMVEAHANGLGVATDRYRRAWGVLHPHFYVVGSLLTGQLLESTAVPELRAQAAEVVERLIQAVRP